MTQNLLEEKIFLIVFEHKLKDPDVTQVELQAWFEGRGRRALTEMGYNERSVDRIIKFTNLLF